MTECDPIPALHAEKPYLSDAIHYPTDIDPYPFVCLWAGVGAGKNTFIEHMVNGNTERDIPRLTVLLISSRKAKVVETLKNDRLDIANRFTNAGNLADICRNTPYDPDFYRYVMIVDECHCEIYQRSLVCTNAAIETYHQYYFDQNDPTTHLWNRFDVIVWDEVHSLVMDSTFQSAPYHVLNLFKQTYLRMKQTDNSPRCKHLIFMTGTPEPFSGHKLKLPKDAHILDLREVCHNVSPKNIHFLDSTQAQLQLRVQLAAGERVVYFANHVALPDSLSAQYMIPREKIAVSFSDEDRRTKMKKECEEAHQTASGENDYERMNNVEKYLSEHNLVRSDIALFYTTSRNKEGINIEDDDIHHVYIESHSMIDIKQMAGRIRKGADHVYIIMDSKGHGNAEHPLEQTFVKSFCKKQTSANGLSRADTMLKEFCSVQGLSQTNVYHAENSKVGEYIDLLKTKSPYIEYNYFKNSFRFNSFRKYAREFAAAEARTFNEAAEDPVALAALFRKEFPTAQIHLYRTPADEGREYVLRYLKQHPEKCHPYAEIISISMHLRELFGSPKRSKKSADDELANLYLHKVGYHCKRQNNNSSHPNYSFCTLEPYFGKKSKLTTAA